MSEVERPELRALTGARGIAAWMVVMFHLRLSIAGLSPDMLAVFGKGYLAVDFFFLLSGFVIWMTWVDRIRLQGWKVAPHFLQKRIARIWPLHGFMLAVALLLAGLFLALDRPPPFKAPLAELPLHILLLQNWGFTSGLSWNDPSWSISCELGAYLLFPLLALGIDWRRMPTPAIVAAIGAFLVILHAVMADGGALTLGTDITRFGLLRCALEFASGSAICALWMRWRHAPAVPGWSAAVLAAGFFFAWLGGLLPETLAVPASFACLLLALALSCGARGNVLETTPIHYLGEISYATYLGHFLLFAIFKLAFVDDPRAIPPVLVALFLVMVLMSSIALYHLVERPGQRGVNALTLPGRSRKIAAKVSRSS